MSRVIAFTWGIGVVLAVASPLFRNATDDGYPLSTFPMFATPREQPTFYSAEAIRAGGSRVTISSELIANGAAMQSAQTLRSAHAQGKRTLRQLCERIAKQVPQAAELGQVECVELVTARYDPIAYFVSGPAPLEREVLHKCRVRPEP